MATIVRLLPLLVCGGGMYLCMRMMMGGRRQSASGEATPSAIEVAELRQEVARLREELERRAPDASER